MVDYRVRGVHDVKCLDTGLEFQVVCYGIPDPLTEDIGERLRKRGFARSVGFYSANGRFVTDKFDLGRGRTTPIENEFSSRRHYFNTRIDDVVSGGNVASSVEPRDGAGGAGRAEETEAAEGRIGGSDQGETR